MQRNWYLLVYIEIAEMLNNHFSIIFTSENLNNVPDFNLSYKKKIEVQISHFRINEQIINKCVINLKLSKCAGPDEISPIFFLNGS